MCFNGYNKVALLTKIVMGGAETGRLVWRCVKLTKLCGGRR